MKDETRIEKLTSIKKTNNIKRYIIENPTKIQCFTQKFRPNGLFYKTFIFTEVGILFLDTGGQSSRFTKSSAMKIIKSERLSKVTIEELLENWASHSLWDSRIIEKSLVKNLLLH